MVAIIRCVHAAVVLAVTGGGTTLTSSCIRNANAPGYKDAEYVIDGRRIKLSDGVSKVEAAPGPASTLVTRYGGTRRGTI